MNQIPEISFKTWLKIFLWAIIIHIILIVLSVLEVFIYSLFNPNLENSFYTEHAELTGPYISIFFGFFIFYFVARSLSKNLVRNKIVIAFSLPIIYTIMDFLMVHYSGVNWDDHMVVFAISFFVKVLASFLGVFSKKGNEMI